MSCRHDAVPGDGAAVGLIVLQSDAVLERELRAWLPARLRLFHTRIANDTHVSAETLRAMERRLPAAAALLPDVGLDVVAYGCTSASTLIGAARVAELIAEVVPGAAVTNPITALETRLASLGVSRIALLTPYAPAVSRAIVAHLEHVGIEVRHAATFDEPDDSRVARIAESSTLDALVALGRRDGCDAVFGSCTNLRSLGILDEAARRLGKPVLTSNSALAWHIERLAERVTDASADEASAGAAAADGMVVDAVLANGVADSEAVAGVTRADPVLADGTLADRAGAGH